MTIVTFTGTIPDPIPGPPGVQGIQGLTGAQGPPGANGTNGTNGRDGVSPTIDLNTLAAAVAAILAGTVVTPPVVTPPPPPPPTGSCVQGSNSYVMSNIFDAKQYGKYLVQANNWGGTPGFLMWSNSEACWSAVSTATKDNGITGYPCVTRGWTQNQTPMQALSTKGTNDWTTKSGMGIAVPALTKANIHWEYSAPLNTGTTQATNNARNMALIDNYFHTTATPAATVWPPVVDLMIDQSIADQIINSTTYYELEAQAGHASLVTIGGNTYLVYVDDPDEASYHSTGGHTIHLFSAPVAQTGNNPNWGVQSATHDMAAIVRYFSQSNPVNDAGKPLLNYAGAAITSPLITPNLFYTSCNAGFEMDVGSPYKTTNFYIALPGETG